MLKIVNYLSEMQFDSKNTSQLTGLGGIIMVISGILIYFAQSVHIPWLTIAAIMILGAYFFLAGVVTKKAGIIIAGGLVIGGGGGYFVSMGGIDSVLEAVNVGWMLLCLSAGWGVNFVVIRIAKRKYYWWILLTSSVLASIGYSLSFIPQDYYGWGLSISLGTGLGLIIWGIASRYIGLIIPGSLLITIGSGVYFAWRISDLINPLSQTGKMLVFFSFGWFLITFLSRMIVKKFLWWPLIPGGILAIVGFGLSIGGNPTSAFRLISNSGSIGLIIFGLYLLLMKMSIRK